jgi:hypothetical protein
VAVLWVLGGGLGGDDARDLHPLATLRSLRAPPFRPRTRVVLVLGSGCDHIRCNRQDPLPAGIEIPGGNTYSNADDELREQTDFEDDDEYEDEVPDGIC